VVDRETGSGTTARGTVVAPAVVERLACDAGVVALIEDEQGNVIDAGRKRRTVSTQLKRALAARDPQCRFPGCSNRAFLDAHHVVAWSDAGETNLDNLLRACTFHHDLLHDGYRCTIVDGTPVFSDRDGRPIAIVPERHRVVPIDRDVELHARRPCDAGRFSMPDVIGDLASAEADEHAAWLAQLSGGRLDDLVDEWQLATRDGDRLEA